MRINTINNYTRVNQWLPIGYFACISNTIVTFSNDDIREHAYWFVHRPVIDVIQTRVMREIKNKLNENKANINQ
jgi:hypothetical protein